MNIYISQFLTIALLHLLALMSPGPDFVLISKNSLVYSRKTGIYTALGLALGITTHIAYSLVGIAYIISRSIVVFSTIKLLGAGYLIYIGYKSLKAEAGQNQQQDFAKVKDLDKITAIKNGFLTNILNPKASLFFFALFTQVVGAKTPVLLKVLMGVEMSAATFVWFSFVAAVLSIEKIKRPFARAQHYIEKTMGGILILLGIKVALSKNK